MSYGIPIKEDGKDTKDELDAERILKHIAIMLPKGKGTARN